MIACCGLTCSECPALLATKAGDAARIAEVAAAWSAQFNTRVEPEHVWCDGCIVEGRKCAHCGECEIRACAMGRGLANCALCDDYACGKLAAFFEMVPPAKATLDGIRARV